MRKKFTYIQVLRSVAAALVVLHHFYKSFTGNRIEKLWLTDSGIGDLGEAGVDIFFVISGFIMFYTQFSSTKVQSMTGLARIKQFLTKRVLRIYPLYWFWTTVQLVLWKAKLLFAAFYFTSTYILMSYVLVPWFNTNGSIHPFLVQGWTLSLEMYFYVIFSITFLIGYSIRNFWYMVGIFFIIYVGSFGLPIPANIAYLVRNPLILEFLYGGVIALIVLRWNPLINRVFFKILACFGLCILLIIAQFPYIESIRCFTYGLPAALIVFAAAMADKLAEKEHVNFFTFLGDASYSIYLAHRFFCLAFGFAIKKGMFHEINADLMIIVGTIATICISSLAYPWLEKPLTQKLQQWTT